MERSISILVLLIIPFLTDCSSALSCYSYDGFVYPDQQICPGTSQCCGIAANCTENRLCDNQNDPEGTFVRGPCAVYPWDPDVCATICLYDERPQGGIFPRATTCEDGSYCCNNDSACCAQGRGVFLDRTGNIIQSSITALTATEAPSLTGTTASSPVSITAFSTILAPATTTSDLSISPTTSNPSTSSTTSNTSSSLSHGVKVGLGVGVSLGAIVILVLAVIAWILWKRSRPSHYSATSPSTHTPFEPPPFESAADPTQKFAIKGSDRYQHVYELPPSSPQELEAPMVKLI